MVFTLRNCGEIFNRVKIGLGLLCCFCIFIDYSSQYHWETEAIILSSSSAHTQLYCLTALHVFIQCKCAYCEQYLIRQYPENCEFCINFTFCSGFLIPFFLDDFYGKTKEGLFYCVRKNPLDFEYMNGSSGVWQEFVASQSSPTKSTILPNLLLPSDCLLRKIKSTLVQCLSYLSRTVHHHLLCFASQGVPLGKHSC